MKNYKIKVNVEFVECNEEVDAAPREKQAGGFEFNISEATAISIDKCEQALLIVNYEAVRDALSKHFDLCG
ncbi:MAG: hypothetical protein QME49_03750 [bacterium]|nr:hypothetical protein [bacterium]